VKRRRRLSQQALRAMGATPGLMARRYDPDGRARLEQITAESSGRRQQFARRLSHDTKDTPASEEGSE
jgi:hypothetical protein